MINEMQKTKEKKDTSAQPSLFFFLIRKSASRIALETCLEEGHPSVSLLNHS